ncbi:hypothetical protein GQ53DRAFT_473894 [Thozetella sp. PMI_491]|nr:hypothetical protein GQ53DRAFT_473894 [Thozetella sp. PMI_491]
MVHLAMPSPSGLALSSRASLHSSVVTKPLRNQPNHRPPRLEPTLHTTTPPTTDQLILASGSDAWPLAPPGAKREGEKKTLQAEPLWTLSHSLHVPSNGCPYHKGPVGLTCYPVLPIEDIFHICCLRLVGISLFFALAFQRSSRVDTLGVRLVMQIIATAGSHTPS